MYARSRARGGLGFPIVPAILGGASVVGSLFRGGGGDKDAAPSLDGITRAEAKEVVAALYQEILQRTPPPDSLDDPLRAGSYVNCLIKRGRKELGMERFGPGSCNVDDVRKNLLESEEYRNLQFRQFDAAAGAGAPGSSSAGFASAGGFDIGQYLPFLIGGVVLLSVLKK